MTPIPTPPASRLDRAHLIVDNAYAALTKAGDFIFREQQRDLSYAVAESFVSGKPLVAEAPTGTGKTIAYLIGALAASETSSQTLKEPVIISTATKALQAQLVTNDLPKLAKAGVITLGNVAIAKGKGNYLCLNQAEEVVSLLDRGGVDPELYLGDSSETMDERQVTDMVKAFNNGSWNGDFDSYEGVRPKNIRPIAVASDTCIRKKCPHYEACAYYRARSAMTGCKIVVSNHDLLLLDLWLVQQGMEPTLPVANYLVVFDEAHHLPEKAIRIGSTEAPLTQLQQALPKLTGVQKLLKTSPELRSLAATKNIKETDFERVVTGNALRELVGMLTLLDVDEDSKQRRFAKGTLPDVVQDAIKALQAPLAAMLVKLTTLAELIRESGGSIPGPTAERASELLRRALDVKVPAELTLKCFTQLLAAKRTAKWLFRKEGSVTLHTAPLEAADVLETLLWANDRAAAVVMVSATLRDLGGFSRFSRKAGVPANAHYQVLPYTFPYAESKLTVAPMKATPKQAERRQFLPELALQLPSVLNAREGTLILFPSWSMMKEFGPKLKAQFGDSVVKIQGETTVKLLVRAHCAAMDRGEGSILVGVATLAEGLDLPGAYCTHVVIITLPFAVPNDPVEQELADMLGNRYFSERSLPDAMVRLTQMVGRLLRRETDRGRVTVFDRRLASTSYGRQMLANLPPFEKVIAPIAA